MDQRLTMHIVGGNSRSRAAQSHKIFAMGHHAEVYSDLAELLDQHPNEGIIIASHDAVDGGTGQLLDQLADNGIWLPLVVACEAPGVNEVVVAIQAGALDFIALPLSEEGLRRMVAHVHSDAGRHAEARRRLIDARHRISALSKREREVLDWLAQGCSNKAIALELEISPRTVEIHRANMMGKLGANHAAEAVRLRLEAGEWRREKRTAGANRSPDVEPAISGPPPISQRAN
ncbi:helix-turn-helix transcriptional regulator [Erythrobacter arachoides]|uniref:Helix-turn-helix transcriptional regulator n=1 Tax=Aurantiacibacter arachoides TaxID=1850444 RepID=A0A845A4E4_9SPHN|nr:LuxR C-terminal-related transcriptional regulator [Aurantiacibacter arachoides]MXO93787.1 helix-turn-helix transcriptional regulator [Aurantiacibacter arachoides]GGD46662.1 DNA-binding response regulator [Aurantiacibacter arachoides]